MKKLCLLLLSCGLLTAAVAAPAPDRKPIDVLLIGYYIWAPDKFVEDMARQGIYLHQVRADRLAGDPKLYPPEFLQKFNVVIVSGPLGRHWSPRVIHTPPQGLVDRLLAYRKSGGAVVWIPLGVDNAVADWNEAIGKKIGVAALDEHLVDDSNTVSRTRPGASTYRKHARFVKTGKIAAHPAVAGVKTLYLPLVGEWSSPGTLPMQFGPGWEVLVRAEPSTVTRPAAKSGVGSGLKGPALIGVNDTMAVWPMYTSMTWGNYGHIGLYDTFLKEGDGEKLFVGLLRYLTRNQKNFGGFHAASGKSDGRKFQLDLSAAKLDGALPHNASNGRSWSGLFGARTAGGGGSGTVGEYAAAAKAAGLGFLGFVEDPNRYTPESYAAFVAECKKHSTPDLALLPGYGGFDTAGAFRFFVNAERLPDAKTGFLKNGKIDKPGAVVSLTGWGALSSMGYFQRHPYDPWWNYVTQSAAVLVYENGRLTDNGVPRWLATAEANSGHLAPLSLTWMNRPDEVAANAAAAHRTVVYGNRPDAIKAAVKSGAGGGVMPTYLSNGPKIVYWGGFYVGPSPWRSGADRIRIGVVCASPDGLKTVTVRDVKTGKIVREWHPGGAKEFRDSAVLECARQMVLSLTVADNAGKTAIAAPYYNYLDSNRVWLMGDRLMGMNHMTDWDERGERLVGNHAGPLAIPYVKTITDACGTNPRSPAPEALLKLRGFDGGHAYLPDMHINPRINVAGGRPERHVFQYYFTLGSHDLVVYDKIADKKLADGAKFDFSGTIPKMEPREIADVACRNWIVRQNLHSDYFMIPYELKITFKRDVRVNSIWLTRGGWSNADNEFDHWYCRVSPTAELQSRVFRRSDRARIKNVLQPGGYVYQAPILGGAPAFVLLDSPDPVSVDTSADPDEPGKRNGRSNEFTIKFPGGREFKRGETYTFSLLMATRKLDDAQSKSDWVDRMLSDFGVHRAPGYSYRVLRGKLRRINYFFDVESDRGGAEIAFQQMPLGQRLPVRVFGLPDNASVGEYNPATGRVRFLPVFEHQAVSTFNLADGDRRSYLGALLTWDTSEAVVNVTHDGVNFPVEVHNPTARPLTVTLTGAPGFAPLANWRKAFSVAPYATVKSVIESAPGTVKPAPLLPPRSMPVSGNPGARGDK